MQFNPSFFPQILRSERVNALCREAASEVLSKAQANAPWLTGDYSRGLHIEVRRGQYRDTHMVVGSDDKTMIIEARTGNLARALKAVK